MDVILYMLLGLLGLLGLFAAVLILSALAVDPGRTYSRNSPYYRALLNGATGFAMWLLGVRIRISGAHKLPKEGRFLLVSNHRSNYDPIVTWYALRHWDLAFVSKPENFRIPVFGRIIRKCCFLPIDREDPRKAIRTINEAARLLQTDAVSVGIYPEGTRNRGGGLLPFHNGVFKIAQKAGVPIVVVHISGTERVCKNILLRPSQVRLQVLRVIPAEDVVQMRSSQLGSLVKETLETAQDREREDSYDLHTV